MIPGRQEIGLTHAATIFNQNLADMIASKLETAGNRSGQGLEAHECKSGSWVEAARLTAAWQA